MIIKRSNLIILIFAIAACSLSVFAFVKAEVVFGVGFYKGGIYEANKKAVAVIDGGITGVSESNSMATNKLKYISFLKSKNDSSAVNSGGYMQNRDGAAFIVCSMLLEDPTYNNCKNNGYINETHIVSTTTWTLLSNIINSADVDLTIDDSYTDGDNSAYNADYEDFYYLKMTRTHPAIVFKQKSSGHQFRIYITCANPLGDLPFVINPHWTIEQRFDINNTSARVGTKINWTYFVKNAYGANSGTLTKEITYSVKNDSTSAFGNSDVVTSGSLAIGTPVGVSVSIPAVPGFNIPSTAVVGSSYCRILTVSDKSDADSSDTSITKCVTVVSPGGVVSPSSYCRPIKFIVRAINYPSRTITDLKYTGSKVIDADTVPVIASTSKQSWGPYSDTAGTEVYATDNHTTGDFYPVTIRETRNHLIGYTDIEVDDTTKPNYRVLTYYDPPSYYSTPQTGTTKTMGSNTTSSPVSYDNSTIPATPLYGILTYYDPSSYYGLPYTGATTKTLGSNTDGSIAYYDKKFSYLQYNYSDGSTSSNPSGGGSWPLPSADGASPMGGGIGPCYNYELNANINDFSGKVEAGSSVNVMLPVSSTVYSGIGTSVAHTKSMNTNWYVTRMTVPSNTFLSYKLGGISTTNPCAYFDPSNDSICSIQTGSAVFGTDGSPSGSIGISSLTAPDSAAGTKICVAFSIKNSDGWDMTSTNGQYSHASFDPEKNCIILVRKPKVQVWGGDIWSRGSIQTSRSIKNGNIFGSWSEYGIFSVGQVNNIASGAAFAGMGGLASATSPCNYNTLTFSNVPAGGTSCNAAPDSFGNYSGASRDIPDVSASFPVTASTSTFNSGSLDGLHGVYTANDSVTITGGNIQKGQWVVINAPGQIVNINGNITYSNVSLSKIDDIPQVVIIAGGINIDGGVNNIDSWLISRGDINTCSSVGSSARLTINDCNNGLVVNGPVMANRLYLRRTYGSGVGILSNEPAEIFNTRADAYLWAFSKANTSGRAQTVYSTELPPRF